MDSDLTDILDRAAKEGLTAYALGKAGGQGERTGHRLFGGHLPKLGVFRRMVSAASRLPRWLKRSMIEWVIDGSGFGLVELDAPELKDLDADGSGDLGRPDAYIHLNRAACGLLSAATEAVENGQLDEALTLTKTAEGHVFKAEHTLRRLIEAAKQRQAVRT